MVEMTIHLRDKYSKFSKKIILP